MRIKLDEYDRKLFAELRAAGHEKSDLLLRALIKISGSLVVGDDAFRLVYKVLDELQEAKTWER